jgi:hypothetical protein
MARLIPPVSPADAGTPAQRPAARRFGAAIVVCVAILVAGAFPASQLVFPATGAPAEGARLSLPASYVVLAPLSDVLDALSLFSVPQHGAFVVTELLAYAILRITAARARRTSLGREAARAAVLVAALAALYIALAVLPRPMARLDLARADDLAFDVHAHTEASHDGRAGFTPERVRQWHRDAGFAAVYVTDHRSFAGAAAGVRANPPRAGLGTSLFRGIEVISARRHVNVLGAAAADSAHFRYRSIDPDSLSAFRPADGSPAVVVLTIPGSVADVSPRLPLHAVELSDAAPRGLRAAEAQLPAILRLARTRHLALVAGSDNHGWGRTSAAWTLVSIPGWRAMAPAGLDLAIRRVILDSPERVRVVARRRLQTGGRGALVATVPRAAWLMARTLTWPERAVWIAWIAAFAAIRTLAHRRPQVIRR